MRTAEIQGIPPLRTQDTGQEPLQLFLVRVRVSQLCGPIVYPSESSRTDRRKLDTLGTGQPPGSRQLKGTRGNPRQQEATADLRIPPRGRRFKAWPRNQTEDPGLAKRPGSSAFPPVRRHVWTTGTRVPYPDRVSASDPVVEYARPHGLRRMLGRDPNERHRAATPLELLFDLTFVVAFAQAGDRWRTTSPRGTSPRLAGSLRRARGVLGVDQLHLVRVGVRHRRWAAADH